MAECLLGLGSNLGDRVAQLQQAGRLLDGHPQIYGVACSAFHETAPIGGPSGQKPFLNAALRCSTSLSPLELLAVAHQVEQQLGRQRHERWGPRPIDIDILLYDDRIEDTDKLVLPHPRMALRRFVLAPACEVAADMVHPRIGWTVRTLLQRLAEPPFYVAIAGIDTYCVMHLAEASAPIAGAHILLDPSPRADQTRVPSVGLPMGLRELDTIAERCAQLSALPFTAPATAADWYVGSYWLPQSLAVARAWLDGAARAQVERACTAAIQQAPLPHCVVFLDTPTARAEGAADRSTFPHVPAETAGEPAALARELAYQVTLPHQGPVLRIADGDLRIALTELTAAIDAMR